MIRDTINYMVVGVFVLGLFAALMLVLYEITGRVGPTDQYTVIYRNIAGVKFGTPVLYEGYPVGQVEVIEPVRTPDGMRYRLTLSVTEGWGIPEDSIAKVVASGLLATMTIEIVEGESTVMLDPGAEIAGQEAVNVFAAVNEIAADFQDLSRENIRPLLDSLGHNIDRLTQEMIDLTNEEVRPLLVKLGEADFIHDLNNLVRKLDESAENLQVLLGVDNQEKVSVMLDNLEAASGNLDNLLVNIDETRVRMDGVLAGVGEMVDENRTDLQATVSDLRLAMDALAGRMETITYHLEGSSRNLSEFTRHIRANPGALLRGRPPEQEMPVREEQ